MLATAENVVTERNPIIQQAMTDALIYVDSFNAAAKDPLDNVETQAKQTANKTLDKGLKMLKDANQSALFRNFDDRLDNPFYQPESAILGSQKKFSLVDYSPTRTLATSEPAKKPVQR